MLVAVWTRDIKKDIDRLLHVSYDPFPFEAQQNSVGDT